MDVKREVHRLIQKYETDDPFRLAREHHIQILFGDLGGKFGNYLKYKRSKYIIIDDIRTPEWMQPYVCAHELGHASSLQMLTRNGSKHIPYPLTLISRTYSQ